MRAFVACVAAAPFASQAAGESGAGSGFGLFVFIGFVAVAYLLVAVLRSATGAQRGGQHHETVDEFVRRTTPSDRPSIER
jgi:uncharacterized membrane protein